MRTCRDGKADAGDEIEADVKAALRKAQENGYELVAYLCEVVLEALKDEKTEKNQ